MTLVDLGPNYSPSVNKQELRIHPQATTVMLNAPLQQVVGLGIPRNIFSKTLTIPLLRGRRNLNTQLSRVQLLQKRNGLSRDGIAKRLLAKSLVMEWFNANCYVARDVTLN
jgi:hypothetical protein